MYEIAAIEKLNFTNTMKYITAGDMKELFYRMKYPLTRK